MGTLNAKHFTEGDPAVVEMLENCANGFPSQVQSHFSKTDNKQGEHIRRVQTALKQIQKAEPKLGIPDFDVNGKYDGDFAHAVFIYKKGRNLRNFADQIDDVIGVKTMRQMDDDIAAQPAPGPQVLPVPRRTPADILVRFLGAANEGALTPDEVLPTRLIPIYKEKPDQPFKDEIMVHTMNERLLIRIGKRTNSFGAGSAAMFNSISFHILALMGVLRAKPDRIYIHGSSSGGRNAVNFAQSISRSALQPSMLAVVDAAFFDADTLTPRLTPFPDFIVDAGSTPPNRRVNWWQSLGNHLKPTLRAGIRFTSKMPGEEIHGTINGFKNIKLDEFLNNPPASDFAAHEQCGNMGNAQAELMIANDILKLLR